jgi:hypothetical protein
MTKQSKALVIMATLGTALLQGCAFANPHQTTAALNQVDLQNRVAINNRAVEIVGQHNVLELLEGRVTRSRFLQMTPLVVVDGVPLNNGIDALRTMSPHEVQSITTLWPQDAAFRYGQIGDQGAIVVTTKRGYLRSRAN